MSGLVERDEIMQPELTESDRRLLDHLQREVPLTLHPYRDIAAAIGTSEQSVLDRVRALSGPAPAPIRQVSAIFDSRALGYQSCLVAAKIDEPRLLDAVQIINGHPGVSHNYQREHAYNVWFTLAVPPDSRLGLEGTVARLRELTGATQMRLMPAIKLYKIGVKFDLGVEPVNGQANGNGSPHAASSATATLREVDKRMIRVLQQHLPVEARPFDSWAEQGGVTVEELLAAAAHYCDVGVMRRFSAVLRHREIGVSANAMGVWVVPPEQHDAFGELAAQNPSVSHCYLRPSYPDWPYSIFTMVHGKTRDDCEAALAAISLATRVTEYASLYSTEEFKKVRVQYFKRDIEQWEAAHNLAEPSAASAR